MKRRVYLFILFAAVSLFANASVNDTVWTIYEWDGYKVSVFGGDLYYYTTSKVLIESSDPNASVIVNYNGGTVEKVGKTTYLITPDQIGLTSLKVNNISYPIQVFPIQEPRLYLDGDTRNWKNVISVDDLKNTKGFSVKNKAGSYPVKRGTLTFFNKQGDMVDMPLKDSLLPIHSLIENSAFENGKNIYFEDIEVTYPDGSYHYIDDQYYLIVDSYENEFVRKTVSFLPNSTDLDLMKTDLRIRIEGIAGENDIKAVNDLATELNGILQTIQVKITDYQPNLRIIFDSTFSDSVLIASGYTRNRAGLILRQQSLFFPFRQSMVMYVNPKTVFYSQKALKRSIVELLGNFNLPYKSIGKDSSIFERSENLSSLDKYMLGLLYSGDGEFQVKQMLNKNEAGENKADVFIITLVLSICLFFLFSELYKYYGFDVRLKNLRFSIVGKFLEAFLVAQIPVLTVLIMLSEKFIAGDYHEADLLLIMEYFFIPFAVLCTLLFAAAELLLKKIKKTWLAAIFNMIVSFAALFISYQLIYFFISPELISLTEISWQVLLVGFLIVLYRMYVRLQSQKIAGLLQQKELELSKQKELKFKSDLNALQARINPHFLYNSLNSIASLAHSNADKTESMALSLSKLFRYNLNKEDEMYATISDEAAMTSTYLEIEKIRFEDKMSFSIEVQESLQQVRVPKFILQPLAENAVKHGISKLSWQGIISIRIFEKDEKIVFEVADNGPEFPGGLMNGYGLQNVYDKLQLLYKKPFDVEFVNSPEKKVVITLNK